MLLLHTVLLLLAAADSSAVSADQPFRLEPGDFRWMTITARKTPVGVNCRFRVLQGSPTVHVELLPLADFRRFSHSRAYNSLALTPDGRQGEFTRLIDDPGQYVVVVSNARRAPPATVTLRVSTTLNPGPGDVATTLSPERRLAVVGASLVFFMVSIGWSGRTLIRAMRRHRDLYPRREI
jgi:hypothetical protein